MSERKPSNVEAAIRQRLLNMIRKTGDDPNLVWTRYATERFLYRLSVSSHAESFILKGALLFAAWTGESYRPTMDVDLLGYGEDSSERIRKVFRGICDIAVEPDGLVFDTDSVTVLPIREEGKYSGQRVTMVALLGKSRIPLQIDVGFGDVVTPQAEKITYPTLLNLPPPSVRAYPPETVVAEKFHAMVMLGIANSRMKDFCDVYILARKFDFDGETLARAIGATFSRRGTDIPTETPLALTDEFGYDAVKATQWKAFVRKNGPEDRVPELPQVLLQLREFLLPPLAAASEHNSALGRWDKGGPWN